MTTYQLGRVIGSGGMGVVHDGWICDADGHRERVAIKRLLPELQDKPCVLDYFEREARLNIGLAHPNVVMVYELARAGSEMLLVMELVDGASLTSVAEGYKLDPAVIRRILRSTLQALAYLHKRNVLHRDITPGNIMLARTGEIKLGDLGLSKRIGTPKSEYDINGTPAYMSPEGVQGSPTDIPADLYSVAAVGFWLLVGEPPFGSYLPQVAARMETWDHPPLPDDVPDDLRQIVDGGLTPLENRVFRSAQDMLDVLDRAAEPEANDSRIAALVDDALVSDSQLPDEPFEVLVATMPRAGFQALRRRRTRMVGALGAAAVLIGAWLALSLARRSGEHAPARQSDSISESQDVVATPSETRVEWPAIDTCGHGEREVIGPHDTTPRRVTADHGEQSLVSDTAREHQSAPASPSPRQDSAARAANNAQRARAGRWKGGAAWQRQ